MPIRWTAVVPVRDFTQAKTRLNGSPVERNGLAQAFVTDLISALREAPQVEQVVVVTSDPAVAELAATLGARTVTDPGTGLNDAIRSGAGDHRPVAIVLGDLPCVRASDVTWALSRGAEYDRAFIPDASGVGTTVLTCTRGDVDPAFGEHSAAAHAASGAVRMEGAAPALHRDVDTDVDLWDAVRIGVGRATKNALQER